MLIAIEGSHAADLGIFTGATSARADYANSHVHRLYGRYRSGAKSYILGPGPLTLLRSCRQISMEAWSAFTRLRRRDGGPIVMAGWSRGAATCVMTAAERIPNEEILALFLFDCVDMDPTIDCTLIPPNVRHVFHARRGADSYQSFPFPTAQFRCASPSTHLEQKTYQTSHSSMGTQCEQAFEWIVSSARGIGIDLR